jgi:signal transduction histidine kinase
VPRPGGSERRFKSFSRSERPFGSVWLQPASRLSVLGKRQTNGLSAVAGAGKALLTPFACATGAGILGAVCGLVIAIWALTRRGYFWPEWVLLPVALVLAAQAWLAFIASRQRRWPLTRPLVSQLGVSAALWLVLVGVWAVTTRAYFWPVWVLLALLVAAGVHLAIVVLAPHLQQPLVERVRVLTATRAATIEEQETQLRQIERDLHDGAQARLVALGMTLALAEQRFRDDPDAAHRLVSEARADARLALDELRDLARGIHPPLLTDRGLGPALEALAAATPVHVDLRCDLDRRPTAAVETAAYFVTAEALANAVKHGGATLVTIGLTRSADQLRVEIVDNGHGGAEPAGSGLSGLRRRLEALDGSLTITSPPGGPTVVRAEIPCGS